MASFKSFLILGPLVSASLIPGLNQYLLEDSLATYSVSSTLDGPDCYDNFARFANFNGKNFVMACDLSSGGAGREIDVITTSSFAECVEKCGEEDDCKSVDFKKSDGSCRLSENSNPPYSTDPGYDNAYVTSPTKPDCPSDNGTYRWVGGQSYKLACGFQPPEQADFIVGYTTKTMAECVNLCGATIDPPCKSAFRTAEGSCNLFSSNGAPGPKDKKYDYAYLNMAERPECPAQDRHVRVSNKRSFKLTCGKKYGSKKGNSIKVISEDEAGDEGLSAGSCIDFCAEHPACNSAEFSKSAMTCSLLDNIEAATEADDNYDSYYAAPSETLDCPDPDADTARVLRNDRRFVLGCEKQVSVGRTLKSPKTDSLSECVDLCSRERDCHSVERQRSSGKCNLKDNQLAPAYANKRWDSAFELESPSCPSSDNNVRMINGETFRLGCKKRVYSQNPNLIKVVKTTTSAQCVDLCANTPGCQSGDWNRTDTNCWVQKEPGPFKQDNAEIDGAYLLPRPTCPSQNNWLRVYKGRAFKLGCGTQYGYYKTVEVVADFGACVDKCAASPSCNTITFGHADNKCWMHTAVAPPKWDNSKFSTAYFVGNTTSYAIDEAEVLDLVGIELQRTTFGGRMKHPGN